MSKITNLKPFSITAGALLAASTLIASPIYASEDNPFQLTDLSSGYMVADGHGKHCKMKKMDSDGDGAVSKDEFMSHAEKKFSMKDKNSDGVLSDEEMKKNKEGKCGEGKCGEKKSN
jgi:hypothetical protein